MGLLQSTGERLRRANQLWHIYLSVTGQRFELAHFVKDAACERQVLDVALASGDKQLVALANDWLRDTGQALPAVAARVSAASRSATAPTATAADGPKPSRYLRGVR